MNKLSRHPKCTLIGAGPGDPDLITVKGLKKLVEADVVLYDALVNTDILRYAPKKSIKLFVGKRSGAHQFSQENINEMLLEYALTYGHVVRLKGGDPFIFGRGFEELSFLSDFNIPVEVIPGISSSIGIPALCGIPLTYRGFSESFMVITGTTRNGQLSKDIEIASRSTATLVILMGMKKLPEIVQLYIQQGKPDVPVMIIENGSLATERKIYGSISKIQQLVIEENFNPPAIIIIGDSLHSSVPIQKKNEALLNNRLVIDKHFIKGKFSKVKYANYEQK